MRVLRVARTIQIPKRWAIYPINTVAESAIIEFMWLKNTYFIVDGGSTLVSIQFTIVGNDQASKFMPIINYSKLILFIG